MNTPRLILNDTLFLHLIIQITWIFFFIGDFRTKISFLTLCFIKTSIISTILRYRDQYDLQRLYRLGLLFLTLITEALIYILFFLDYRTKTLLNVHLLSPMIITMLNTPGKAMKEDWNMSFAEIIYLSLGTILCSSISILGINSLYKCTLGRYIRLSLRNWRIIHSVVIFITFIQIITMVQYIYSFEDVLENRMVKGENTCQTLPIMKERPNIVIVMYDSGRSDLFTNTTFPQTHRWFIPKKCQTWDYHYSGGVQSDSGHVALMYGIIPTRANLVELEKKNASSWPIDILKHNGYTVRSVSSSSFEYCWALGINCKMHRKIFDRFETPPEDYNLLERESWVAQRAYDILEKELQEPYLLVVNFDATHYPYAYPKQDEYFKPAATTDEIWNFIKTGSLDKNRVNAIRNRYKNSARYVDFLINKYISPHINLDKTIFMLTSDHGEFLTEHGRLGHTIDEYYEEETHITALYCSKILMTEIKPVTNHLDVMISILKPYLPVGTNIPLPGRLLLLDEESQLQNTNKPRWGFSTYPWSKTTLLTDGTIKIWSDGYKVQKMTNMDDDIIDTEKDKYKNQINYLNKIWLDLYEHQLPCTKQEVEREVKLIWLGLNKTMCLDRKNPSDGSLHVYNCWNGWNQKWIWNTQTNVISIQVKNDREYLGIEKSKNKTIVVSLPKLQSKWEIVNKNDGFLIKSQKDRSCISVDNYREIIMQKCNDTIMEQRWRLERA